MEPKDLAQSRYERARGAALDSRVFVPWEVENTLRAHGVAGLLIRPEDTVVGCSPLDSRMGQRRGTAFHHAHLSEEQFATIACSLAEGVGVSSTARIQGVNKKTVLRVLVRAADHADRVSRFLLRDVVVSECQLDEMWSFIGKKEANLDSIEDLGGLFGDAWIWIAFDAGHKVVLAYVVGKRTRPHAVALLQEVRRVTARMPALFSSDQLDQYTHALLQVYGTTVIPPRKPGPGRPPKPRLIPSEDLLYVQVVKQYERNRVAKVTRRVVFGDPERIATLLQHSTLSKTINTAYIERHNGTVRHLDARCNRKTYRFSKCKKNHERQLALSMAYYHLCRAHRTLTQRSHRPTTPFMAAGFTDHVWEMAELLRFRPEDQCS